MKNLVLLIGAVLLGRTLYCVMLSNFGLDVVVTAIVGILMILNYSYQQNVERTLIG